MTEYDRLEQRLSAVERVVVDGDATLDELSELTSLADTVSDLETRLEEHERRLADLEGAVQSVEGYVGNVESITDDVERQSAAAIATVDRLERRVEALEVELDDLDGGILETERDGTDVRDSAGDGADGSTPGAGTDREADADSDDEAVFAFGDDRDESAEPEPERSARDVLEGEHVAVGEHDPLEDVDFVDEENEGVSTGPSSDSGAVPGSDADATDDGGLFDSLRSRLT